MALLRGAIIQAFYSQIGGCISHIAAINVCALIKWFMLGALKDEYRRATL
jgi:hypothetical protein